MDPDENREMNLYFSVLSPFTTVTSVEYNFFCYVYKGFFQKNLEQYCYFLFFKRVRNAFFICKI